MVVWELKIILPSSPGALKLASYRPDSTVLLSGKQIILRKATFLILAGCYFRHHWAQVPSGADFEWIHKPVLCSSSYYPQARLGHV